MRDFIESKFFVKKKRILEKGIDNLNNLGFSFDKLFFQVKVKNIKTGVKRLSFAPVFMLVSIMI